jgi:hypothetical protein
MTTVLHLPTRPGAPIACDMRTAADTPGERLAEYGRLFRRALVRRRREHNAVVFAFAATAGTREALEGLARREAACCPFLDQRLELAGEEITWTITHDVAGPEQAAADAALDAFASLPGSGVAVAAVGAA